MAGFMIGASLSLVTAFFEPAAQAVILQLVEKEDLNRANSMNQMVSGLCTILGPVLGATAISLFGVTSVFLFNGISYFISALFSKMIVLNNSVDKTDTSEPVLKCMKVGIIFIKANRELLRIIGIIASVHFFMGSLMVMMPFLANGLNGKGVQNLGYLETFLGIGLLAGALYISRKKNFLIKETTLLLIILAVGSLYLCIGGLQLASLRMILPYLFTFLVLGCTISQASVFWQSLIQQGTPEAMAGRVFSVSILADNVSLPIAYGLFGILMTFIPISLLMLFCGCGLLLLSGVLLLTGRVKKGS
jgi:MFS family permease